MSNFYEDELRPILEELGIWKEGVGMSLKSYFPDFVAVDDAETHWLLKAKGQENIDMIRKDDAALRWCENAFKLTGTTWRYV